MSPENLPPDPGIDASGSMPPHDELAERATLGAMMMSPRAVADCLDALTPDHYWSPRHAWIFEAIRDLSMTGVGIDPVTVQDELAKRGRPDAAVYLLELLQSTPTAANAGFYAEIVADRALRRWVGESSQRALQWSWQMSDDGSAVELLERVRGEFDRLSRSVKSNAEVLSADDLAVARLEAYTERADTGLPTGWSELDRMLGGLHPGRLYVVGARPGVGKSVIGANLATKAALSGVGAAMMSLEMTRDELMDRTLASMANVELTAIQERRLSPDEFGRLRQAQSRLRGCPLKIVDLPELGLAGMRTISRDLTRTARGLGLLVVDYLQLVKPVDGRAPRQEQVASLSRGLKLLAKELRVPVVALSQVNRGPEARSDKRPSLADLRESGAIEADADVVVLLHVDEANRHEIELIVAKNRHGPKGMVKLQWAPWYARAGQAIRHLEAA